MFDTIRWFPVAVLSATACLFLSSEVAAATARVRWSASGSAATARYDVYVRGAGTPYGAPAWSGNPSATADGALEALVPFTVAEANFFAVVAVGAAGESLLSRELALGTPAACRADSCTSKTACDFGVVPDGTACDDGGGDPCGAVCASGACTGPGVATELLGERLRFRARGAGVKLSLRGRFLTEAALDPAATGVALELRASDGTILWTATVGAAAITPSGGDRRFHFDAAANATTDPAWSGLRRLDSRRSGARWIVTALAKTPALAAAAAEPGVTLVLRLGGACVR